MESTDLNLIVAANVIAAIKHSNSNPTSVARDTGISQTDMHRKLKTLNGASFTVGNLALIAELLQVDVTGFFEKRT